MALVMVATLLGAPAVTVLAMPPDPPVVLALLAGFLTCLTPLALAAVTDVLAG